MILAEHCCPLQNSVVQSLGCRPSTGRDAREQAVQQAAFPAASAVDRSSWSEYLETRSAGGSNQDANLEIVGQPPSRWPAVAAGAAAVLQGRDWSRPVLRTTFHPSVLRFHQSPDR